MPCKVGDDAWRVLAEMMMKWGPNPCEDFFFAGAFVERQARQSCRNVRIWDRTSRPTSHFRTRFGSNMRPNFGLYVRIGIGHGPNFGLISVRIGIGHVPALSSVLTKLYLCDRTSLRGRSNNLILSYTPETPGFSVSHVT